MGVTDALQYLAPSKADRAKAEREVWHLYETGRRSLGSFYRRADAQGRREQHQSVATAASALVDKLREIDPYVASELWHDCPELLYLGSYPEEDPLKGVSSLVDTLLALEHSANAGAVKSRREWSNKRIDLIVYQAMYVFDRYRPNEFTTTASGPFNNFVGLLIQAIHEELAKEPLLFVNPEMLEIRDWSGRAKKARKAWQSRYGINA